MGRNKNWSPAEFEYLQNSWGSVSIPGIAKHLGRSVNAVKIKAQRLHLGAHLNSGTTITFLELLKEFGRHGGYTYFKDRLVRNGFPIRYQRVENSRFAVVDIDEFWKWAEQHKTYFDFSKLAKNALGKEPEWVDEARCAAYKAQHTTQPWTKAEDQRLEALLGQYKYTYTELAEAFCRTEGAIKRRITDLGLLQRPIRRESKAWEEYEVEILKTMREAGHCFEEIGRRLGRTGLAVRGKYERLYHPEYTKRAYRKKEGNEE